MILFTDIKLTAIALVLAIAATLGVERTGNSLAPNVRIDMNPVLQLVK
jgi:hypothetical protein